MSRGILLKFTFLVMFGLLVSAELAMAQGFRGGPPGGGRGGSALGLLANEKVQAELELVDDQIKAIEGLSEDMRNEMREMFSGMQDSFRNLSGTEREEFMNDIRTKMTDLNKDFENRAYEELLPHQIDRLKQLMFQSQTARSGGVTRGALPENLIEELGITEEQLEKMKEKAEKVREDLNEKIAKLRKQAEDEILSVLDAEQREKYRELTGDSFDFGQPQGFGFQGRGGGAAPGGRGGAPGGGRGGRGGGAEGDGGGRSDF